MSRRKKNAGRGFGMMFHGAFGSKEEAKKKERKVHGFIQPRDIKGERRYVVMSERKNPIRRKKKNPVLFDPQLNAYSAWERTKKWGTVYGHGSTQREATRDLNERLAAYKAGEKPGGMKGYGGHNNPMDLMVMGANPGKREKLHQKKRAAEEKFYALSERERQARRSGSADYESLKDQAMQAFEEMERARREYDAKAHLNPGRDITVHPGETITLRVNPETAQEIREEFVGREYESTFVSDEPHMRAGNYAQLGDLMGISFKPTNGGQVEAIGWYEGSDRIPLHEAAKSLRTLTDAPVLVSDETRRQLYLVGGNQDLSRLVLGYIDAGQDARDGDLWELGTARTVVYRERKWMDKFRTINYQHRFGEESGRVPKLLYDARIKRLLLEGGDYEVRPEGIVN